MMKNNFKAFTLLELSIVLVIVSLLMLGSLESGRFFLLQNHIKATNIKLRTIQNALDIYVVQNGHLPCPAALNKSSGKSVSSCTTNNPAGGVYYANGVARGAIPYEDLNLTSDISHDAWKGKITYSVATAATENIKKMNDNDFDGITIYDNSTSGTPITDRAVYTIVSHGQNKLGAYGFSSNSAVSTSGIGNGESKNISTSAPNQNVYFSDYKKYDDLVRYKTRMQLINDANIEDINCYIDNSVVSSLLSGNNITGSHTFTIPASNYLNFNQEIKSSDKKYKIKCFKFGRLGVYEYEE